MIDKRERVNCCSWSPQRLPTTLGTLQFSSGEKAGGPGWAVGQLLLPPSPGPGYGDREGGQQESLGLLNSLHQDKQRRLHSQGLGGWGPSACLPSPGPRESMRSARLNYLGPALMDGFACMKRRKPNMERGGAGRLLNCLGHICRASPQAVETASST